MRSNGLATILLLIPVLTVPALAIFGIPQFAPVVASPLNEGLDFDRETRVGNSARQSHDEFFGDVENFGSDPANDEDATPKRRKSTGSTGINRRENSKRSKEPTAPAWGDDLAEESDWPSKPRRRLSQAGLEEPPLLEKSSTPNSSLGAKRTKGSSVDQLSRERPRPNQEHRAGEPVRIASTANVDREIVQSGFEEDVDFDNTRPPVKGIRSRPGEVRNAKRNESVSEPLTWSAAVERLNQLEIRSFRLEPGHQLGQFVFICMYTPRDNPRVSHRFEAEADQPLKAVENVLEQIVEWQQRR